VLRVALPLFLLVLVALPAVAHAVWSSPVFLSRADKYSAGARVAVDADGDAVFTWAFVEHPSCCQRVQVRARSATGALSPTQTVSAPGQSAGGNEIAVDAEGDALVVWIRADGTTQCGGSGCSRVQARVRSAAGTLGPVQTLSAPGQDAGSPRVALDSTGDAVVVWRRVDGSSSSCCSRIQARARSAAGVLGPVETLSDPGQDAFGAEVGVDADGDALVTWARRDGTTQCGGSPGCFRVQARARSATGTLGQVQTLSAAGQNAQGAHLAVDPDGDAVVVWARTTATQCGGSACRRVQARARSAANVLSAVQDLSIPGQDAISPDVGIDAAGNAVFVWHRVDPSDCCVARVHARARTAEGSLSPVQVLSIGIHPRVAVDAAGNAVFVWHRFDGSSSSCCLRVQARARSATGTLTPVKFLQPPGTDADFGPGTEALTTPRVGISPDGHAVAVWTRWDGILRVETASGP
jgi:hypothetical protein